MTRFFVIFNPAARGEKSRRLQEFLAAKRSDTVTLAATERAGDAPGLAARAAADGYGVIVAAGGDGTINEVVNGIGTSGVPLGVLRVGTVNVFARELGIPRNLAAAWALLESGRIRAIDLGCAETTAATGAVQRRYFVQLAGVGFDAWAVEQASWPLKKWVGSLSYVWAGLKAAARPCAAVEVRVGETGILPVHLGQQAGAGHPTADAGDGVPPNGTDRPWEGLRPRGPCLADAGDGVPPDGQAPTARGAVVLIGNGRLYGGQFAVFPAARLDDGRLDVCVFARGGYLDVLRYAQGVCRGRHTGWRDVTYFQAERFVCHGAGATVPFELDGEIVGRSPVAFSVVPRALRVVAP